MRRSALLSALGALGQRIERRMLSLIIQLSLACSSVTVPLKPLSSEIGNRFVQRRRLKCQVMGPGAVGLVGSQGLPWFHSEAFLTRIIQIAKSVIRGR
jgi:hypothetical protein